MKPLFAAVLGVAAIALGTLPATIVRADNTAQAGSETKAGHKHGVKGSKDKHIQQLTTALGLTDDQVGKVKAIYKDQKAKAAIIKSDPALSPDDKRTKITALRKDTKQQIDALLTDDQQQKLRQYQKERRMARREHKQDTTTGQVPATPTAPTAQ